MLTGDEQLESVAPPPAPGRARWAAGYVRNGSVNLLNLHYGLQTLATGSGGVFVFVFLLEAGVPMPMVLASIAAILAARFCLRPLVLPLAKRFGLRATVMAGAVLMALQYPLVAQVRGVDVALLVLCAVAAAGDALYWTSYHAYFASLGDAEDRGSQIGAREALAQVVGIAAPLIGGWALMTLGPTIAFGAVAGVQALSAAPLLGAPRIAAAPDAPGALAASRLGFLLFVADGWVAAGFYFVWQISLFVTLGRNFTAYGGALALAALAGALAGLVLGKHIDAGHGRKAAWIAFLAMAATIVVRALAATAPVAIIASAMGAIAGCLYIPTLMTAVYNEAQRSPCALRFHMVTEGAWDIGCGAGCLTAAGLAALGVPLSIGILISLGGAAAALILLRRYYGDLAAALALRPAPSS